MMRQLAFFFTILFSLALFADESARTVTIGLLVGGKPEDSQKQAVIFAEKLQDKLGKPVQIFVSKDYSGLIQALKNKKVDFALFTALTYVIAEKQTPVKVLLKKTWEGPYYYSSLVVSKKSKIKFVKDLKKKSIVFVDKNSTSGYLYPQIYLRKNGLLEKDFKSVSFSGNHSASIENLESGQVDVAAVFADEENGSIGAWTRFAKKPQDFKVIWVSDPIPNDPLVVRQQFYDENPKLTLEIMYDFIEVQNETKGSLSEITGKGSMMPATAKQYDPVREMYSVFEKELKL